MKEEPSGLRQAIKAFALLSGVGIYFVVFVGICLWLGNLADETFGLGYAGKLIGILIGFPGAIYTLYRQIKENGVVFFTHCNRKLVHYTAITSIEIVLRVLSNEG